MEVESAKLENGKSSNQDPAKTPRRHRCRNVCIGVVVVIVAVVLLIVILAFTVFKPKNPVTTVNAVSLKDLDFSVDALRLRVSLNVTLNVDLSISNPNKVGFRYANSTALLNYRGQLVGEAPIVADKIKADEKKPMNLSLTLLADRFLSDSRAYTDVLAGELPLNTHTEISGRVTIMNLFKIHVDSTTSCDITVFLSNRTVGNQHCEYKTKL